MVVNMDMENAPSASPLSLNGLVLGMQPHMPLDVQMNAAHELLLNLDGTASAVAIPSLIVMLRQDAYATGAGPAMSAATVLCVMAYSNEQLRVAAVTAGAIPALVEVMQRPTAHPDVKMSAAIALVKLAANSVEARRAVVDAGGIPTMASLLHWKDDGAPEWDDGVQR